MTREGYRRLSDEMHRLKSEDRPNVIKAIAEAREHGDLSENAEYHAARERQSHVEGRIKELSSLIGRADVIDVTKLEGAVKFGATVTIKDRKTDETRTYQIVSEAEADVSKGLLNINSPLASAMIGMEPGDIVPIRAPAGLKSYKLLAVEYV